MNFIAGQICGAEAAVPSGVVRRWNRVLRSAAATCTAESANPCLARIARLWSFTRLLVHEQLDTQHTTAASYGFSHGDHRRSRCRH
jgi:hypothetical protein